MMRVRLETQEGAFVSDEAMPPFKQPPGVVIWGQRVFAWKEAFVDEHGMTAHRYREVFTYWVNGLEKKLLAQLIEQTQGDREDY
jgi:hypothetical protein